VFLNSLGIEVSKQAFGKGGKVCLQLENPTMSFDILVEKLLDAPSTTVASASTTDGIEVGDEKITFTCPFSLGLITYPGRGKNCTHAQCFDLEVSLVEFIF
jgi:hypothetical protein